MLLLKEMVILIVTVNKYDFYPLNNWCRIHFVVGNHHHQGTIKNLRKFTKLKIGGSRFLTHFICASFPPPPIFLVLFLFLPLKKIYFFLIFKLEVGSLISNEGTPPPPIPFPSGKSMLFTGGGWADGFQSC